MEKLEACVRMEEPQAVGEDAAQTLARRMADYQPIPWELLPDLGLYMDQVITFLERQLALLHPAGMAERILTPSMINNYVKQRVIPRPNGKKYEREHLAALLMVCALKQVLPIDAVTRLIAAQSGDTRAQYEAFCAQQSRVLTHTGAALLREESTALTYAVEAAAQCLAVEALLARAASDQAPQKEPKPIKEPKSPKDMKPTKDTELPVEPKLPEEPNGD